MQQGIIIVLKFILNIFIMSFYQVFISNLKYNFIKYQNVNFVYISNEL